MIENCKRELAESKLKSFLADMARLGYDRSGVAALLTDEKEGNADADS